MAIIDSTLTSRYELKYVIKPSMHEALLRFCEPFIQPDKFTAKSEHGHYTISSLYLDTRDLTCYHATNDGEKNRFKMRIRTYDDSEGPAFFEIKKRLGQLIRKSRAHVSRADADHLLNGRLSWIGSQKGKRDKDLHEFLHFSQRADYFPILTVKYQRQALQSRGSDPVRVTFDSAMQYAIASDTRLSTEAAFWRPIPVPGIVMELKFTDCCPSWAVDMVRFFQLQRQSVSKYKKAVDHALGEDLQLPAVALGTSTLALLASS